MFQFQGGIRRVRSAGGWRLVIGAVRIRRIVGGIRLIRRDSHWLTGPIALLRRCLRRLLLRILICRAIVLLLVVRRCCGLIWGTGLSWRRVSILRLHWRCNPDCLLRRLLNLCWRQCWRRRAVSGVTIHSLGLGHFRH